MRGWRALFRDPDWSRKLTAGSVLISSGLCVPIVGQLALMGHGALAMRRAVHGDDRVPPLELQLDYLGKLVGLGMKPFIARLVYPIVLTLVLLIPLFCLVTMAGVIGSNGGEVGDVIGTVLLCLAIPCGAVAMLLVQAVTSVATLRASLMENLGAALRPKEVFSMTRLLFGELMIGSIVITLATFAIGLAGYALCLIGFIPAVVVISYVQAYFDAELYRRYLEKGGAPLPIGATDVVAVVSSTTRP